MNNWSTGIPPVEPGKYKEYLVTINKIVILSVYFNNAFEPHRPVNPKKLTGWYWFDEDGYMVEEKEITAWMEKPKPYENV